jgi:hypothetical protein
VKISVFHGKNGLYALIETFLSSRGSSERIKTNYENATLFFGNFIGAVVVNCTISSNVIANAYYTGRSEVARSEPGSGGDFRC